MSWMVLGSSRTLVTAVRNELEYSHSGAPMWQMKVRGKLWKTNRVFLVFLEGVLANTFVIIWLCDQLGMSSS